MNIEQHRATGQIPIDSYVKSRVVELGRSLDGRAAIYLDTKFWVLLRKVSLGTDIAEANLELLRLLRLAVANGLVFCPISESTFLELLKQSDGSSRLETAKLIDELSLGVTLLTHEMRVTTELAHFIHTFVVVDDQRELHPLRHLIWSKLSYVLGFMHPTATPFDTETELAIQKAFFDRMWTIPLATMVEMIGEVPSPEGLKLDDLAATLNDGNVQHAGEMRCFAQVWADELRGAVDLCADTALDIIADVGRRAGVQPVPRGSAEWAKLRSMTANLLFHALRTRPETRSQIPTIYVEACLHAAFRWDKARRFRGNDLYDFHHASAALSHCRAFFTEHSLRSLVTSKPLKLQTLFNCCVVSEVHEAIAFLKELGPFENA